MCETAGILRKERSNLFASVLSAAILGIEVRPVQVEADVSNGLPILYNGWFSFCSGEGGTGQSADSTEK